MEYIDHMSLFPKKMFYDWWKPKGTDDWFVYSYFQFSPDWDNFFSKSLGVCDCLLFKWVIITFIEDSTNKNVKS